MDKSSKLYSGWAAWFVGLPGSGKSSIAANVAQVLQQKDLPVVHLQLDKQRKNYFPKPTYSAEERRKAYELFVLEGAELVRNGRGVIMDGSAPRLEMRSLARQKINNFAEVYIHCPVEVAMKREANRPQGLVMADLYAKALERKRSGKQFAGLGEVIGVDIDFEQNPDAECKIDNINISLEQAVTLALEFMQEWLSEIS